MPPSDTKTMIEGAVARLIDEVPALRNLALVVRLELRERGGPAIWKVETPGPKATRDPAATGKLAIVMERPAFNTLSEKAHIADWITAYQKGVVKITGDANVMKLIGKVIQMRQARQG